MVTRDGERPRGTETVLGRMRDRLGHRGPDGAGMLLHRNMGLGHTRLAILDPSDAGHEPMRTADGRFALVYNGELYNDAEMRGRLAGVRFGSGCDAETVLELLARDWTAGLGRMRGMFGLAIVDGREQRLLLARDALGIKPLYYWRGSLGGLPHVVFASEIPAILEHPAISARPDLAGVTGYLTTIRTVQGERTLFEGVRAVRPGEWIEFDLRSADLSERRGTACDDHDARALSEGDESECVRRVVTDSVHRHMRSDVPMCSLLSGGLDSTIIASIAAQRSPGLATYCAGSPSPGVEDDDLAVADVVGAALGVRHTRVEVSRELFLERWPEMVGRLGVPLSTPNEVAIYEVARRLRRDGYKVALSGEGADEFFAGYDGPLTNVRRFLIENPDATVRDRAAFELESNGWVGPSVKAGLLQPALAEAICGDDELISWQTAELAGCDLGAAAMGHGDDSALERRLAGHLLLQQRVNLVGLLGRLDSATMLASVEGRTPLADVAVGRLANGLPIGRRIAWVGDQAGTKIALREAFGDRVPRVAVERAKASFPLPFIGWLGGMKPVLEGSGLLREVFAAGAIEAVARSPEELWRLAWPMMNLALWDRAWWGQEKRPGVCPGAVESVETVVP